MLACARVAAAQTVIVRSAPPGAAVEVTLDGGRAVTATADNFGDATLAVSAPTAERSVQFHVDVCGSRARVLLVSRGLQPPPAEPGCTRTDIPSAFIMRPVTTFVVDIEGPATTVHVAQGPAPIEWTWRGGGSARRSRFGWGTPAKGLTLSADVGFSAFGDAVNRACGNVACQSTNLGVALGVGADYWITRYLAAHVGYLRPADVTANGSGSGDTFRFDSRLQARLLILGAKVGVAVGSARLYGIGGMDRHQSTFTTTEIAGDATQSFGQQSEGWSWAIGGGAETWIRNWIAFYGELTIPKVKGTPVGGGEGGLNDRATFALIGARVRLGR